MRKRAFRGSLAVLWGMSLALFGVGTAAAADSPDPPFRITDLQVAPGTGNQVILNFAPQLVGQGDAIEQQLNTALQQNGADLSAEVNSLLGNLNLGNFSSRSANAMALAGQQAATDDASAFEVVSLGVGASVGLNPADPNLVRAVIRDGQQRLADGEDIGVGIGAAAAVTLGINFKRFALPTLGALNWRRVQAFVHVGTYKQSVTLDADTADVAMTSWGFAGRYALFEPVAYAPFGLLRWGGLRLGAGFNTSKLTLSGSNTLASQTQTTPTVVAGRNLELDLVYGAASRLGVKLAAMSIPLEATTSMQLGYLLTFYGGGGVDFNFGTTSVAASSNAPMTLSVRDPANGRTVAAGNPTGILALARQRHPTTVDVRGMVGLQVNLGVLGVYGQAQATSSKTAGFNCGLRGFW